MRTNTSPRLTLEPLESRWVPAQIQVVNGNLFINNPVGSIFVDTLQTNPDEFSITDGSGQVILGGVTGDVKITGTDLGEEISFNAINRPHPGELEIKSFGGDDLIQLRGQIGSVRLLTGAGDDTVTSPSGGDLTIDGDLFWSGGGSVSPLGDVFDLATRIYAIGGDLTLRDVGRFDMGPGGELSVGGSASFNARDGVSPMTLSFNGGEVVIDGGLTVNGAAGNDVFSLLVTTSWTVNGRSTLRMGDGTNTLSFGAFGVPVTFNGDVAVRGGRSTDGVTFGGTATVNGSVRRDLGNGANFYSDNGTNAVTGNFSLTGDDGSNSFAMNVGVGGDLSVKVGNGTNSVGVTGAVGGEVVYRGGRGTDTLGLFPSSATTYVVDILFGRGTTTLNLGANLTLDGQVRGGRGGVNTFNPNAAVLAPTLKLINYP
jgi:hypothetical protein